MVSDKQKELEANLFAMELLMPESLLSKDAEGLDLTDMRQIAKLAKKYAVEESLMAIRLGQLYFNNPN